MLSKKVIKDIQSLGHKKYRNETGLFVAEGPKIVNELLELCPQQVQTIYATAGWQAPEGFAGAIEIISEDELKRISQLKTPHQVLAVAKQFDVVKPGEEVVLYLDTIQDPGNFGTLLRIADWFGLKFIACTPGCADLYNPKVVQASMGSLARVHVFYDEDAAWLKSQKNILAAALNGTPVTACHKLQQGVLLIGNESKGINKEFLQLATEVITIPRLGGAESLNAAVATGIILSHLLLK